MYLKRIEIAGFKSFADRTKIEFEEGVTAVIGPEKVISLKQFAGYSENNRQKVYVAARCRILFSLVQNHESS